MIPLNKEQIKNFVAHLGEDGRNQGKSSPLEGFGRDGDWWQELTLVAKKFMERTVTAQEVLQNVTDNFAGSFFTAGHSPDPLVQATKMEPTRRSEV